MAASVVGGLLRSASKAVEAIGFALQSPYGKKETLNRAQTLLPIGDKAPKLGVGAFVAPSASVIGDVELGAGSSVWYGAVVRADVGSVSIGARSAVQENAVVHVARHNAAGLAQGTSIGSDATIGHGATVHAATVGDGAVVGIGATLLDGSKLEPGALLAAGAVLAPGAVVPSGAVWAGTPARHLRDLAPAERAFLSQAGAGHAALAALHAAENAKGFNEVELDLARREDRIERDPDYDTQQGIERNNETRDVISVSSG